MTCCSIEFWDRTTMKGVSKCCPGMLAAHQKFLDWFKKSAADPIKTAIQNPTEVTGDLIGN